MDEYMTKQWLEKDIYQENSPSFSWLMESQCFDAQKDVTPCNNTKFNPSFDDFMEGFENNDKNKSLINYTDSISKFKKLCSLKKEKDWGIIRNAEESYDIPKTLKNHDESSETPGSIGDEKIDQKEQVRLNSRVNTSNESYIDNGRKFKNLEHSTSGRTNSNDGKLNRCKSEKTSKEEQNLSKMNITHVATLNESTQNERNFKKDKRSKSNPDTTRKRKIWFLFKPFINRKNQKSSINRVEDLSQTPIQEAFPEKTDNSCTSSYKPHAADCPPVSLLSKPMNEKHLQEISLNGNFHEYALCGEQSKEEVMKDSQSKLDCEKYFNFFKKKKKLKDLSKTDKDFKGSEDAKIMNRTCSSIEEYRTHYKKNNINLITKPKKTQVEFNPRKENSNDERDYRIINTDYNSSHTCTIDASNEKITNKSTAFQKNTQKSKNKIINNRSEIFAPASMTIPNKKLENNIQKVSMKKDEIDRTMRDDHRKNKIETRSKFFVSKNGFEAVEAEDFDNQDSSKPSSASNSFNYFVHRRFNRAYKITFKRFFSKKRKEKSFFLQMKSKVFLKNSSSAFAKNISECTDDNFLSSCYKQENKVHKKNAKNKSKIYVKTNKNLNSKVTQSKKIESFLENKQKDNFSKIKMDYFKSCFNNSDKTKKIKSMKSSDKISSSEEKTFRKNQRIAMNTICDNKKSDCIKAQSQMELLLRRGAAEGLCRGCKSLLDSNNIMLQNTQHSQYSTNSTNFKDSVVKKGLNISGIFDKNKPQSVQVSISKALKSNKSANEKDASKMVESADLNNKIQQACERFLKINDTDLNNEDMNLLKKNTNSEQKTKKMKDKTKHVKFKNDNPKVDFNDEDNTNVFIEFKPIHTFGISNEKRDFSFDGFHNTLSRELNCVQMKKSHSLTCVNHEQVKQLKDSYERANSVAQKTRGQKILETFALNRSYTCDNYYNNYLHRCSLYINNFKETQNENKDSHVKEEKKFEEFSDNHESFEKPSFMGLNSLTKQELNKAKNKIEKLKISREELNSNQRFFHQRKLLKQFYNLFLLPLNQAASSNIKELNSLDPPLPCYRVENVLYAIPANLKVQNQCSLKEKFSNVDFLCKNSSIFVNSLPKFSFSSPSSYVSFPFLEFSNINCGINNNFFEGDITELKNFYTNIPVYKYSPNGRVLLFNSKAKTCGSRENDIQLDGKTNKDKTLVKFGINKYENQVYFENVGEWLKERAQIKNLSAHCNGGSDINTRHDLNNDSHFIYVNNENKNLANFKDGRDFLFEEEAENNNIKFFLKTDVKPNLKIAKSTKGRNPNTFDKTEISIVNTNTQTVITPSENRSQNTVNMPENSNESINQNNISKCTKITLNKQFSELSIKNRNSNMTINKNNTIKNHEGILINCENLKNKQSVGCKSFCILETFDLASDRNLDKKSSKNNLINPIEKNFSKIDDWVVKMDNDSELVAEKNKSEAGIFYPNTCDNSGSCQQPEGNESTRKLLSFKEINAIDVKKHNGRIENKSIFEDEFSKDTHHQQTRLETSVNYQTKVKKSTFFESELIPTIKTKNGDFEKSYSEKDEIVKKNEIDSNERKNTGKDEGDVLAFTNDLYSCCQNIKEHNTSLNTRKTEKNQKISTFTQKFFQNKHRLNEVNDGKINNLKWFTNSNHPKKSDDKNNSNDNNNKNILNDVEKKKVFCNFEKIEKAKTNQDVSNKSRGLRFSCFLMN